MSTEAKSITIKDIIKEFDLRNILKKEFCDIIVSDSFLKPQVMIKE